jgi:Carbohydrate esterase, sialic acid-specific acetylesterase
MANSRSSGFFAILMVVAWSIGWPGPATAGADEPKEKCHLYLLIGQSNMAGRGKVEKEDRTPHPRVLVLNKEDEWKPAVDPLHFDKASAGVGPGLAFGKAMADADKDITIGLIPCAAGGSPITVWKKDAVWSQTKSKPYDEMLRRVAIARKRGVLKGILWHQGESDSTAKDAKLYADRLADLATRLRRDLEMPEVPILVGGLSDPFRTQNEYARVVDQAMRDFAKKDARSAYVESDKLTLMSDNTHFDAASAREFGRRYAKAMLQVQKAK